ncbi:glycosyltransferase family 4 protein [Bifidobacterium aerophilum]|uniref:Glycosyltransferase n=1 Tax=Bifidobacterium aerophilum TaxID=1798155 RepID=A0A6N9Z5P3_9BIFI|nr:glycosyltransferase family 4 protein [Bifidobacterium aerophilum]NEG89962.1 glycosyltransferase [Bifidobacterium aerophilum]
MRTAHVVFSFTSGGIEHLLIDLLNNWSSEDQLMLCIINNTFDAALIDAIHKRANVTVVCLNRPEGQGKLRYLRKLNAVLSDFRPNVVHCHSNNVLLFTLPLKLLHPRWKYVYTVHDTNIYNHLPATTVALHKLLVSRITAISKSVYGNIVSAGFPEPRTAVVYNGVDPDKFISHHGSQNGLKTIICVARLLPEKKGQDILIDALADLAKRGEHYRCLFVGAEPSEHPEYRQQLIDRAAGYGLEHVEFLGNRNDIPQLLAQSDIFVLPSRYEGFGIAIIEAMMAKIPVIASAVDGPKEIIGNDQYGLLFNVGDSFQLALAIHQIETEDTAKIVSLAYKHAIEKYSIESMIQSYKNVYQSVTDNCGISG